MLENFGGEMLKNIKNDTREGILQKGKEATQKVLSKTADVGEKVFDEAEGELVSEYTNMGMKGILGEPDGLPKNKEPIQAQTEALKEALDKEEVDFDDLSLIDQFREVGRRLLHLGL